MTAKSAAVEQPEGGPFPRATLTSDLVGAVVRTIRDQGLLPGMRLGTQRDLAARFGVAVPTMREALRQLQALGVLTIRHGSGIYVSEHVNRSILPNMVLPKAGREQLIELLEARRLLEPAVAAHAAVVRAPEGIERLEQLLGEAKACLSRGDDRLWRVNVDLHRAIAACVGNRIVTDIVDSVLLVHADEQRQILVLHGDPDADHAEHEEIVRLITAGAAEEVEELMRRHLTNVAGAVRTAQP